MNNAIIKGDVFYAALDPVIGSEQDGDRPVVVIQNNDGNKYNPTIVVAPITSAYKRMHLPTHIFVRKNNILRCDSVILVEQIKAIDKSRLRNYLGMLDYNYMKKIDRALIYELDIDVNKLILEREDKYV